MSTHAISHIEIPGTDPQAAAQFYGDLFGWEMGYDPTYDYRTFVAPPGISGAFVRNDGEHGRTGEILLHIATGDIDATLRKVEALGGQTVLPKTEVPGIVWYATFGDPTGNRIGLSTTVSGEFAASPPTPHAIVHVEIPAHDPQEAARFYNGVFGWEIRRDEALDYTGFDINGRGGGGFPKVGEYGATVGQLVLYVWTDDVDGMLAKARGLGAQIAMPKTVIPNVGWFGAFIDPSGVPIGVFDPRI